MKKKKIGFKNVAYLFLLLCVLADKIRVFCGAKHIYA